MATYFHGNPEIQAAAGPDHSGLQTLILMNPPSSNNNNNTNNGNGNYISFSDQTPGPPTTTAAANNLVLLNQGPPFVGVPLSAASQDPSDIHALLPRVHYNLYNPLELSQPGTCQTPHQPLSLTLSSHQNHQGAFTGGDDVRVAVGASASTLSGNNQTLLLGSKYLKAAQELLDEVVSVNTNSISYTNIKNGLENVKKGSDDSKAIGGDSSAGVGDGSSSGDAAGKRAAELTTAERQEIQMKKAKLINMLDEVEQRYRQYHHQMQIVISSFEQAAGIGSAKTYTSLALKTISKQFRCLKDAITAQIRAANKCLGEEDSSGGKIEGSRLKFVDHHLRQQRALQQLGMIQQNAWRPQRGLPERSVSVLRAWLFEHFLHPYPKDSDKHMLAKQTGLTRNQVSNWFINARVRLWKPMVEEMYLEEMKEQEKNGSDDRKEQQNKEDSASKSIGSQEKTAAATAERKANNLVLKQDFSMKNQTTPSSVSASASTMVANVRNTCGFSLIGSSELEGITQGSPKRPRSSAEMLHSINMQVNVNEANNEKLNIKFGDERQGRDGYSFMGSHTNFIGGFGQYPIGDIGRFDAEHFAPRFSGNGVSLTLGLPHCDSMSVSGTHQNFLANQSIQLGRRVEIGEPNEYGAITTSAPHSTSAYDSINIQNQKRFAAQLLPDFVA